MDGRLALLALMATIVVGLAAAGGALIVSGATLPGSIGGDTPASNSTPAVTQTPVAARLPVDVCTRSFNFEEPAEQVFDPAYVTTREVLGLTIVAGEGVSSAAIDAAEVTLRDVFANNDHEVILAEQGAYVIVAEPDQGVLDLPEFGCLEDELGANFFTHVCGIADRADHPVVTVNALDLLGDRRGPCGGVNILYHELGHMVLDHAADPPDYIDARIFYDQAMQAGLYEGEYASTKFEEYFAEGVQAYFDAQDRRGTRNSTWLQEYDPNLFNLLQQVFENE